MDAILKSLCDEHGLRSIAVAYSSVARIDSFYAYLHWGVDECDLGSGKTVDAAVADAVSTMKERRSEGRYVEAAE